MQTSVTLAQQTTITGGKAFTYWVLRWFDSKGNRHAERLVRVTEMSRRQADEKRREKEAELAAHPERRDGSPGPDVALFQPNTGQRKDVD